MKSVLKSLGLWAYLPALVLGGFYFSLYQVQHSNWYKERLYHQLLSGTQEQRLKAASALAHFGGQQQLLNGLKTETPEVRDLARRALEYSWFRAAGSEANRVVEDAFEAATKKDYQTALSLLNKVVKKYPKYAEGWNRRASLYWQMGEYQKSIADCQTAIALNPNHYGAWQGIGVCHVHLGEISEACRCLRIALKIAPYDETTRHALQKCEDLLKVIQGTDKDARKGQLI